MLYGMCPDEVISDNKLKCVVLFYFYLFCNGNYVRKAEQGGSCL
jgi:hypothetical protein